jgi:MFS family permease
MTDLLEAERRADRFLLLYAMAWAGGSIAYIPFLTILLPVRVTGLVGPEQAVSWLAYIAFAGALAASIGHIGFGYLSDITGNRRQWIGAGLFLSSFLLVLIPVANSLPSLVALIIGWQLALNMMLAPLAAMAGDRVPDSQKGLLGGLMAFAPGLGALSGVLVTIPGLASDNARLGLVAAMVALFVLPVLMMGGGDLRQEVANLPEPAEDVVVDYSDSGIARDALRRMWLARLTVQIGEAALFAFLYLWFRSIDPGMNDNRTASVFSVILILSAPIALLIGGWADRRGQPIVPLIIWNGGCTEPVGGNRRLCDLRHRQ